ncbi:MAG: shikimate dehydrogenase [Terriglobia bacterium]
MISKSKKNPICLVICERDERVVEAAIHEAKAKAGFVELRLDYLPIQQITSGRLENWVRLAGIPVIVTLRRKPNGGEFEGNEEEQLKILTSLLDCGAAYFDLEIETVESALQGKLDRLRKGSARWIVSYHQFQETPGDLDAVYQRLRSVNPDVLKIATKAGRFNDNFRLLELLKHPKPPTMDIILVAMGDLGGYSRILSPRLGCLLTYASFLPGKESAPGQWTTQELRETYRIEEIQADTRIFGIIGYPLRHSLSPYLHNACFQRLGINARHLPLPVQHLEDLAEHWEHFSGLSVTIPHKVGVLKYADIQDHTVRETGAANTLVIRKDHIAAYNSDIVGIQKALQQPLEEGIRRATLLGTGGAARAAAVVLRRSQCSVVVLARDEEKAKSFAKEFGFSFDSLRNAVQHEGDLLINATSVGMSPHEDAIPIETDAIRYRYVFDMVYNPLETRLLREAKGRATPIYGLEMLLHQAVRQFEWWTGQTPPFEIMRKIALERLQKKS